MPPKKPLTDEQRARKREMSLRWYHEHKAGFSEEKKAKIREHTRQGMAKWKAKPENAEKLRGWSRERQRTSYAQDPAAILARNKASYLRHHEKRKAEKRAIHAANKVAANAARRAHHAAHREEVNAKTMINTQKARLVTPWKELLHAARWRAKKKGLEYALTHEWAAERWTGFCEVSGLPFRLGLREAGPKFFSPSIDRIAPAKGYVPDNCRFVLWAINSFKHDATDEDMMMVARALAEKYPMISKG